MKELLVFAGVLCSLWADLLREAAVGVGVMLAFFSFILFLISPFTIVLRIAQGQLHWGWAGLCWLFIAAFAWRRGSR